MTWEVISAMLPPRAIRDVICQGCTMPATVRPTKDGLARIRHAGAARTKGWAALKTYGKKHRGATLEQVLVATSYTRADYKLDIARGALKV
jgi:hypothetical protein